MDNLKKYNDFVLEMIVVNKQQVKEEPKENFTQKEIFSLTNNEIFKFELVLKNKAVCQIPGYILSIYKKNSDDFLYKIKKDVSGPFNPVLIEKKLTNLRDCLYEIDSFMFDRIREDKEKRNAEIKLQKDIDSGLIEKPQKSSEVFNGTSFSGKWWM